MKDSSNLWFKRRRYGWGWTPVTWQGWSVIVIYLLGVFGGAKVYNLDTDYSDEIITYIYVGWVFILTGILVAISFFKGPKGKWRWGRSDDDDPDLDY